MVNRSQADWFHLDIMDGWRISFLRCALSYGLPVVSQIKKIATKPLDVHLMIVQPERYVEAFHKAGADILTVHYETCTHLHRTIQQVHKVSRHESRGFAESTYPGLPVGRCYRGY